MTADQISKERHKELREMARVLWEKQDVSFKSSEHGIAAVVARGIEGFKPQQLQPVEVSLLETYMMDVCMEDVETPTLNAITLIDCGSADTFDVKTVLSFKDKPVGEKAARKTFGEWVDEAAGDDKPTAEEVEEAWNNGRYDVGEGFIAVVRS